MTKALKRILAGAILVFIIAPVLFSQTINRIDFHYYSGITSQDSYAYDMTVKNDGSADIIFKLKGLNENGEKTTSFAYSFSVSKDDWDYLTGYLANNVELIFPGMDTLTGDAGYGVQLFRSKIYFNNDEYFKIPSMTLSKADEVMSPFYSKLKSLVPENIAVDFFNKKRNFYKEQRGN